MGLYEIQISTPKWTKKLFKSTTAKCTQQVYNINTRIMSWRYPGSRERWCKTTLNRTKINSHLIRPEQISNSDSFLLCHFNPVHFYTVLFVRFVFPLSRFRPTISPLRALANNVTIRNKRPPVCGHSAVSRGVIIIVRRKFICHWGT